MRYEPSLCTMIAAPNRVFISSDLFPIYICGFAGHIKAALFGLFATKEDILFHDGVERILVYVFTLQRLGSSRALSCTQEGLPAGMTEPDAIFPRYNNTTLVDNHMKGSMYAILPLQCPIKLFWDDPRENCNLDRSQYKKRIQFCESFC